MKTNKNTPELSVLTIIVGMLFLYVVTHSKYFLYLSLIIGFLGVFSPYLSKKIDFFWMKLALVLSKFIPNILLAIIFFFILFPIALLSKIFSKEQPLYLKNNRKSTFTNVSTHFDANFFEKTW
jgi:ABC-type dipeptide/oligopeptide/nickel transport system permease subunit